jgi:phosphohistidine phosphatase SixA
MKHLFILRHGFYDKWNQGKLDEAGKPEIEAIAKEMGMIINNDPKKHYLIASPVIRTKETAKIIANKLNLEKINLDSKLETRGGNLQQETIKYLDEFIELQSNKYDTITIVGHEEIATKYSKYLAKRLFEKDFDTYVRECEGVYFNIEKKSCKLFPEKKIDNFEKTNNFSSPHKSPITSFHYILKFTSPKGT